MRRFWRDWGLCCRPEQSAGGWGCSDFDFGGLLDGYGGGVDVSGLECAVLDQVLAFEVVVSGADQCKRS